MQTYRFRIAFSFAVFVLLPTWLSLAAEDAPLTHWQAPLFWQPPAAAPAPDGAISSSAPPRKAAVLSSAPLPFVAITPCRVADTRSGSGFPSGYGPPSIGGGVSRDFTIAGQCGIPVDAQAVSFNFTVWNTTSYGDFKIYPKGAAVSPVSTLNWGPGILMLANAAVVPLGAGGGITVVNEGSGTVDLFFDVNGYYSPLGVVNSVNTLSGSVTLAPGANMAIAPSGNTLTISNVGTLTGITAGTGISVTGSAPSPTVLIPPSGILADRIASAQVVKSVNGQTDALTIAGVGGIGVSASAGTVTVSGSTLLPSGSMVLGAPGDTTLIGAGYTEIAPARIDYWTATTTTGAPSGCYDHGAVWTGSRMIVWGGTNGSAPVNDGGQYDPVANSWTPTTTTNAPSARYGPTAVWTGSTMIVWGGHDSSAYLNDGGQYDPVANTWTATTTASAPKVRYQHTAVWTGSTMIVWGGDGGGVYFNDGGRYDPIANAWTATATTDAPSERYGHTAVWTGSRMIVWGGFPGSPFLDDGGQYNPVANTWTATTTAFVPLARSYHTAVWTGSRMVVWGGTNGAALNNGGQYDPVANAWTATTIAGAPPGRYFHTAVWTGSRMIVWGGLDIAYLNDGGQYDPVANTWTATATTGAPSGRHLHTAVWTGSRMIVWGGSNDSVFLNDGGQWRAVSLYVKN